MSALFNTETPNKGLWNRGQSPLFDPIPDKWQIRDYRKVPYLHQNFKKISLKTDQNRNNRYSRLKNKPENYLCRSLWMQLDSKSNILYRIFIEKSLIWPTLKIMANKGLLEKSLIWPLSRKMVASLIWSFQCTWKTLSGKFSKRLAWMFSCF